MSESSLETGFGISKVPLAPPSVNVVRNSRLLAGSKPLIHLARPQVSRFLVVFVAYAACLAASLWLAYQIRFNFVIPPDQSARLKSFLAWVIPAKLVVLLLAIRFDGLLSYFSIPDLRRLFLPLAGGTLSLFGLWYLSEGRFAPPRGVLAADFLISILTLSFVRLLFRLARERYTTPSRPWDEEILRVGIIGAGDVGASLARELSVKGNLGLRPVVFLDDDPQKWRTRIHNIQVFGSPESLLEYKSQLRLDKIILAMPSASNKRVSEIVDLLRKAQIPFLSVPALDQLAAGKVKVTNFQLIHPDDLFENNQLHLELEKITELIEGKVVMVTGAGGSIGSALCRQIATFRPGQLLLLDQCEVHLFQIEQEMIQLGHKEIIVPVIADILDEPRLQTVFKRFRPQIVFHAAAHKHTPVLENQPAIAIQTNALGTALIAQLAAAHGTEKFVLISSDKAAKPQSVIGASKRLAELAVQQLSQQRTPVIYQIIRFADAVGSSERIIRAANKQIAAGGPVRIPHPSITCYSMTVAEASGLVLQGATVANGGDILTLEAGEPIKLLDLVHKMIELSGLKPDQDIEIEFSGLRNGESAGEEGLSCSLAPTAHARILKVAQVSPPTVDVISLLEDTRSQWHQTDADALKVFLQKAVPEYQPLLRGSAAEEIASSVTESEASLAEVVCT